METTIDVCVPADISEADIYEAMKEIPGYLDITPADFKEVYLKAYRHVIFRLTHAVKVRDIMIRDVAAVSPDMQLKEVAQIMSARHISGVPVVDGEGKPVGVISEKDFLSTMGGADVRTLMEVIAQCLRGRSCLAVPIHVRIATDIMSTPVITVNEETPMMEAADIMTKRRINRVPVVDRNGRLVGIISRADIVRSSVFGGRS